MEPTATDGRHAGRYADEWDAGDMGLRRIINSILSLNEAASARSVL